jgi:hypothetical protein
MLLREVGPCCSTIVVTVLARSRSSKTLASWSTLTFYIYINGDNSTSAEGSAVGRPFDLGRERAT